ARTAARPLSFALPPAAAHRLAGALLGLPLPWRRIGSAMLDPALDTSLPGIRLRNPVGLAAGFDKSCRYLQLLSNPAARPTGLRSLIPGKLVSRAGSSIALPIRRHGRGRPRSAPARRWAAAGGRAKDSGRAAVRA